MNEIYWKKNKKYKEENITNMNDVRKNKWISVTCVRKESKFITKLLRKTNIGISYKTNNIVSLQVAYKQYKTWINIVKMAFIF
jgi:hypothetical protein